MARLASNKIQENIENQEIRKENRSNKRGETVIETQERGA